MENKYYTPTLEDLTLGTEYEYRYQGCAEKRGTSSCTYTINGQKYKLETTEDFTPWFKGTIKESDFYYGGYDGETTFSELSSKNFSNCRIKYLDKQDIEGLGFRVAHEFDNEAMFISKDGETQIYFDALVENLDKGIGLQIYTNNDKVSAYIKNKSELIKLLKMLNI
jgi:hypothetical protein